MKRRLSNGHQISVYIIYAFHTGVFCNRQPIFYYLEFESNETVHTWVLDAGGQIEKEGPLLMAGTSDLPLHDHLFDSDALIFKNLKSSIVSLKSRKSNQVLNVSYDGWPYLGIWAKPSAPQRYLAVPPA